MATPIPPNRAGFTLAEIAAATGGTLAGPPELRIEGVSTDSRRIEPGALFVALRGGARDGHAFLAQAAARGAVAALTEPGSQAPIATVQVADTLEALGRLAKYHVERLRRTREIATVAIGGAAGKTTTKELAAAAVSAVFGETLATAGNLNNLIGVPMMLLTLGEGHRAMVIECGTNAPGEIARLGDMVVPDVALVLNVDIEHTEGLGDIEGVADEEAALFASARRAVVYGAEEPLLKSRLPRHGAFALSFGVSPDAGVRVVGRRMNRNGRSRIRIRMQQRLVAVKAASEIEIDLAMPGATAGLNAAAAVAAVAALKPEPLDSIQLRAIIDSLAGVDPVPGRFVSRTINGSMVLDDSYNANPRSMRAALATAREIADDLRARLVLALGDMLELGALAARAHAEVVKAAIELRPAALVLVGPEMRAASREFRGNANPRTLIAADSVQAGDLVADLLMPGDVVLVKGSRGMRLERIIERLER